MEAVLSRGLRLSPPAGLDLSALGGEREPARAFEAVYWDTAERDVLRRAAASVQRRVCGLQDVFGVLEAAVHDSACASPFRYDAAGGA